MTEKTALSMLDEALRAQGYGGLVMPDAECGCEVGDLAPCGSDFASCRPGYKHTDPRPGRQTVWLMCVSQEPPSLGAFDNIDHLYDEVGNDQSRTA